MGMSGGMPVSNPPFADMNSESRGHERWRLRLRPSLKCVAPARFMTPAWHFMSLPRAPMTMSLAAYSGAA